MIDLSEVTDAEALSERVTLKLLFAAKECKSRHYLQEGIFLLLPHG